MLVLVNNDLVKTTTCPTYFMIREGIINILALTVMEIIQNIADIDDFNEKTKLSR